MAGAQTPQQVEADIRKLERGASMTQTLSKVGTSGKGGGGKKSNRKGRKGGY